MKERNNPEFETAPHGMALPLTKQDPVLIAAPDKKLLLFDPTNRDHRRALAKVARHGLECRIKALETTIHGLCEEKRELTTAMSELEMLRVEKRHVEQKVSVLDGTIERLQGEIELRNRLVRRLMEHVADCEKRATECAGRIGNVPSDIRALLFERYGTSESIVEQVAQPSAEDTV
jgi:predicted nuclease with TOPRIM domain